MIVAQERGRKKKSKNKDNKIVAIILKILNKRGKNKENQFTESSGLIHLVSNAHTSAFNCGFLSVPVPSQD
jgi:hypothetical protein